jgi:hypothetical protein
LTLIKVTVAVTAPAPIYFGERPVADVFVAGTPTLNDVGTRFALAGGTGAAVGVACAMTAGALGAEAFPDAQAARHSALITARLRTRMVTTVVPFVRRIGS